MTLQSRTFPSATRQLRRSSWLFGVCSTCRRTLTSLKTIAENDIVLLRRRDDHDAPPILTKPLKRDTKIQTHKGTIAHNDVIGRQARDTVKSSKGKDMRIYIPTLAEYVTITPRIVTPVYPSDANMIVSLLDLHVSPPSTSDYQDDHRLEILEAGTGHGALTLHLARAVHAANPPAAPPSALENVTDDAESLYTGVVRFLGLDKPAPLPTQESPHDQNPLSSLSQKENRRAIIHTLDISSRHSTHASAIVRNFRHGIYANNVDFHVGDVSEWIVEQQSLRRKGTTDTSNSTPTDDPQRFLSHIILDLPNTHSHLASAASALQTDGILTVFNPSITQITACVDLIRRQKLPLLLEQVVELGAGSTGGREWDVRAVRPRALERGWKDRKDGSMATRMEGEQKDGNASTSGSDTESNAPANVEEEQIIQEAKPDPSNVMRVGEEKSRDDEQAQAQSQCQKQPQGRDKQSDEDSGYEMVCRPKVGGRVVGGGFLGVWRRMRDTREGQTE